MLMSAPMVRAILDGTKTQTRRIVKGAALDWLDRDGFTPEFTAATENSLCPYGQPGDQLWVREAWARTTVCGTEMIVYREGDNRTDYGDPWKPGIHMFRKDSRITLEITSVRVERLQDISEADCVAEGCPGGAGAIPGYAYAATPLEHYHWLWNDINGAGAWELNPWVWAVEFRRIKP